MNIWARQDGRGRALGLNSDIKLPDTAVRAADAAWISWERYNASGTLPKSSYRQLIPEFVIELRSDSDRLPLLREKMEQWIANGVELAWLIDPQRKAVEIYRPNRQPVVQEGHSAAYGEGPVSGFVLELSKIWV